MARIFVALHNFAYRTTETNEMPPFFESFLRTLEAAGNDVLCYFHKQQGREFGQKIPKNLLEKIKLFSPEICIFFNNEFYDITPYFDGPILIYDVDSPIKYADVDRVIRTKDRYKFAVNQSSGIKIIQEMIGAEKRNIQYIAPFTGIRSNPNADVRTNIAFCGSHWLWQGCDCVTKFLKEKPTEEERKLAIDVFNRFIKYPFVTSEEMYKEYAQPVQKQLEINDLRLYSARYSGLRRARFLTAVAPLGLEIRGEYWDNQCLNYFPEIALCYNAQPTYSVKATEDFYNSAKIGFSTSHIQAVSGFSWRVCDILASNACLVSEYRSDFAQLFPGVGFPTFSSEAEAHDRCAYVLENPNYRADVVARAHETIEKKFRPDRAVHELEDFLGIPLFTEKAGTLTFLREDEFIPKHLVARNKLLSTARRVKRRLLG